MSVRFECHLVPTGDNPILSHLQGEQGHYPKLQMQPFDALVVEVGKTFDDRPFCQVYLNGKLVAQS